jgi:hypothetical protein
MDFLEKFKISKIVQRKVELEFKLFLHIEKDKKLICGYEKMKRKR